MPREASLIVDAIRKKCEETPNSTAVVRTRDKEEEGPQRKVDPEVRKHAVTYSQLIEIIDKACEHLRDVAATDEEGKPARVVACVVDGFASIISLLTLLQLGVTYMPLSPLQTAFKYNVGLIQRMSDRVAWILCSNKFREFLENQFVNEKDDTYRVEIKQSIRLLRPEYNLDLYAIRIRRATPALSTTLPSFPSDVLSSTTTKTRPAYIIHTSGTTRSGSQGIVVQVSQEALFTNVKSISSRLHLNNSDVIPFLSQPTFDPHLIEILAPLHVGGCVVAFDSDVRRQPQFLSQVLEQVNITTIMCTPSLLESFGSEEVARLIENTQSLRRVVLGGERFAVKFVRRVMKLLHEPSVSKRVQWWNIYGTTECGVWSTLYLVSDLTTDNVPIGEPLAGVIVQLRDPITKSPITQDNIEGEIYLGYTNETPPNIIDGEVVPGLMATGDIGIRRNGQIDFVNRTNAFIKRLGYRIDLASVERACEMCDEVRDCVVEFIQGDEAVNPAGDIVAFLVLVSSQDEQSTTLKKLQLFTETHLPFYSRPTKFISIDKIPLTLHGKVDRKALRNLIMDSEHVETPPQPISRIELISLLRDILNPKNHDAIMAPYAYFTSFGGTSLDAVGLVSRLIHRNHLSKDKTTTLLTMLLHKPLKCFIDTVTQPEHSSGRKHARDDDAVVTPRNVKRSINSTSSEAVQLRYKVDMGSCVDATPLAIPNGTIAVSHLGRISKIGESGEILWTFELGTKVDSTPVLYSDHVLITTFEGLFVVSLDGLYHRKVHQSRDRATCPPVVDQNTGSIWWACDGGIVYCTQFTSSAAQWSTVEIVSDIGPIKRMCIDISGRRLYVASIRGHLVSLDLDSKDVLWNCALNHSIFTTPLILLNGKLCLVIDVDGKVSCISQEGEVLCHCTFEGPVFSSPVLVSVTEHGAKVVFGTHQGYLHCIIIQEENQIRIRHLWSRKIADSPIFSQPTLCNLPSSTSPCLIGTSIAGNGFMIDSSDGEIVTAWNMDTQTFSGVVTCQPGRIRFGARDDCLWCCDLLLEGNVAKLPRANAD